MTADTASAPPTPKAELATMRGFRGRFRRPTPAVAAITLLCLGVYLVFSLTEYNQYLSNGFDLGLFDQAVRSYAHFRAPIAAVKAPGFDLLGDHFSPIVALFAPLYWIWDNPCMLLIAQALLVASSVPIVHRIAARRLPTAPALLMTIVYGLGWPIQSMVNFDVHEVAFAVPMLAAALDAVERRAGRRVLLWSFLLLFVKEDLALVVMAIGVVIAIRGSDERADSSLWNRLRRPPRLAIGLFVMGIVAFVITTKLIIPSLAPDGSFDYWQFDAVGSNFSDAAANIVTEPWHAVAVFFTPFAKSLTLIMLFLPLAAVPLRSPYALITVPLFLERFFNDRVQLWIPQFHYSALPWLVLVVAFVDGAAKLRIFERRVLTRWATTWVIIGQVFTIWAAIEIENSSAPGHGIVQRLADWNDIVVQRSRSAVDFIPADVCVEADNTLLPHLTPRNYATLPGAPNDAPDFVILDLKHPIVGPSQVGPPGADGVRSRVEDRRLLKTGFVVVARFGPIQVYQSPHYTGPSAACGPLGAGKREN